MTNAKSFKMSIRSNLAYVQYAVVFKNSFGMTGKAIN